MESTLLDLREQRCPMALLLAKRHAAKTFNGEKRGITNLSFKCRITALNKIL